MSLYRFFVQAPGDRPRRIKPFNSAGLKIQGKREGDNIFYRRKLSGRLLLNGADFDYLYRVENSAQRCSALYLIIEKSCGGQYVEHWRGVFSTTDCEWSPEKKQVEIEAQPDDAYRKLIDNYSKEHNVLAVSNLFSVRAKLDFDTDFDFSYVEKDKINELEDSSTWALFLQLRLVFGASIRQYDIAFRLKRFADYVNGQVADLSGDGWQVVQDFPALQRAKYAKAPDLYQFEPYQINNLDQLREGPYSGYPELLLLRCGQPFDETRFIEVTGAGGASTPDSAPCLPLIPGTKLKIAWEFATFTFSRNRRLLDVIDFLVSQTAANARPAAPEAMSQFFTAPINYATGEANKLINILVSQKSDITRYSSSERATRGMLSLKSVFDELRSMFRVYWFLDDAGKLRLEHESFFASQGVLNLVRSDWARYLKNTASYTYDKANLPRRQRLSFVEAFDDNFSQAEIEYTSECVNYQEGQDLEESTVSKFTTDLKGLLINSGSSSNGFVLMVQEAGEVSKEAGAYTREVLPNAHLSAANLLANYYRHNRILPAGKVNGRATDFASVKKTRKQKPFGVPACCEFVNPFAKIITTLSNNGTIESWEEELSNGFLNFVVLHEAPNGTNELGDRSFNDAFNESFS